MSHQLKTIIVFGADTAVGKQILDRGHHEELEVTAFVKNGGNISEELQEKTKKIIFGDILNKIEVVNAIKGHDAVLSALECGPFYKNPERMSRGCKNIISGMRKHDVTRIVVVGTSAELQQNQGFLVRIGKLLTRNQDHVRQISLVEDEDEMDWIIMMPPKIINSDDICPDYKVHKDNIPGAHTVTSAELADFMVRVFKDTQSIECFRHSKLGISSRPKSRGRGLLIGALFVGAIAIIAGVCYYNPTARAVCGEFIATVREEYIPKVRESAYNFTPEILKEYRENFKL